MPVKSTVNQSCSRCCGNDTGFCPAWAFAPGRIGVSILILRDPTGPESIRRPAGEDAMLIKHPRAEMAANAGKPASPAALQRAEAAAAELVGQPALERRRRSEEHTSELQSLMRISYAVFCLKKKNIQY